MFSFISVPMADSDGSSNQCTGGHLGLRLEVTSEQALRKRAPSRFVRHCSRSKKFAHDKTCTFTCFASSTEGEMVWGGGGSIRVGACENRMAGNFALCSRSAAVATNPPSALAWGRVKAGGGGGGAHASVHWRCCSGGLRPSWPGLSALRWSCSTERRRRSNRPSPWRVH